MHSKTLSYGLRLHRPSSKYYVKYQLRIHYSLSNLEASLMLDTDSPIENPDIDYCNISNSMFPLYKTPNLII